MAQGSQDKLNGRVDGVTWAVVGLLIISIFYTLYFAYDFFMPFAGGIVLALVLSPIVSFLAHYHVPRTLSAALVLALIVTGISSAFVQLAGPATEWIQNAPRILSKVERQLLPIKRSVEDVKHAADEVEKAAQVAPPKKGTTPMAVVVAPPSMLTRVFGGFQRTVLHLGICVIFAYFLLSYADVFREKLIDVLPRRQQKARIVSISEQIERDVSSYLLAITLINASLGLAVGIALHVIGLPNAPLWGVMAALLNFIPYFGLALGLTVVFVVGLHGFGELLSGRRAGENGNGQKPAVANSR